MELGSTLELLLNFFTKWTREWIWFVHSVLVIEALMPLSIESWGLQFTFSRVLAFLPWYFLCDGECEFRTAVRLVCGGQNDIGSRGQPTLDTDFLRVSMRNTTHHRVHGTRDHHAVRFTRSLHTNTHTDTHNVYFNLPRFSENVKWESYSCLFSSCFIL